MITAQGSQTRMLKWTWLWNIGTQFWSRGWLGWEADIRRSPLRGLGPRSILPHYWRASCTPPTLKGWNLSCYLFTNSIPTQWWVYCEKGSLGLFWSWFLGPGGWWGSHGQGLFLFGTAAQYIWSQKISILFLGHVRLQRYQASTWRVQEEGCCRQEGAQKIQQEDGSSGTLVCPFFLHSCILKVPSDSWWPLL